MAFKMKGSSYKMGGVKTKATMAYMKSPLEQGSTSFIDKVKAAGGALYDNVGKVHGHGTSDSFSSNVAKSYGKKKKGYRKEAADSSKKNSPLDQKYDNIAKIDHKEGTDENIATHKKNKTETYKSDLSADEMNAKLAKTRHLAADKKEATLPDPKKKYPKNEKEPKVKRTKSKTKRVKRPKNRSSGTNLVTGRKQPRTQMGN